MNKRGYKRKCKNEDCNGTTERQELILPKFGEKVYNKCKKCGDKTEVKKKGRKK